ncbi:MAG TPA: tRNA preQ1(34) S-adenosylmethionine ribosyltransferase-isomerase QueA [Candidatus Desulfobacillus sp.]|nr:tRNA preQ1(34) S-adenosylmethionine ribosyltransferase-isomerase QueA [Candidatus Desulfobacillus sp.]
MSLTLADFDYDLPSHLIAQEPLVERTASRLLVVDGPRLEDRHFADLPQLLRPGDLLVFNDSRVLHARLHGIKDTGGRIEVLIERLVGRHEALAQIRASHAPWPGSRLLLEGVIEVEVMARQDEFFLLRFAGAEDALDLLERHGKLPLPPYIQRPAEDADEARYQTVFARHRGSVAAPTAGLHFDEALLQALRDKGVDFAWLTLHVGAGTFQPVRVDDLSRHRMHRERYEVPEQTVAALAAARARGGRVIAVGSTSLRALEAAAQGGEIMAGAGETDLFILPGHRFRTADALLSNFHLPRSTLLMLVSAFGGLEPLRHAYAHAVAREYRFFSYGDAMLVTRRDEA